MVAAMDQQELQTSSRRWMQAALEAFGRGDSLDFAVHHACVALEHLLKAYLCSLHPAMVVEAVHVPSLLHAVGHGDRSGILASRAKSIGMKAAFDRVRNLLKPKIAVRDEEFELVLAARNGVAHVGAHDPKEARTALATCIRVATPVLVEVGIDPPRFWGHYRELVAQLADERVNELRVAVEAKLVRARRSFHQRFDNLFAEHRASVIATLEATSNVNSDYDMQAECPACGCQGWRHGITEVDWHIAVDHEGESIPAVMFYASSFSCTVCGLELEFDELELTNVALDEYLVDEDPDIYFASDREIDQN